VTTDNVECYWPGVREQRFAAAVARLGRQERLDGAVRRLPWVLIREDEIVLGVPATVSADAVQTAAHRAGLTAERAVARVHAAPRPTTTGRSNTMSRNPLTLRGAALFAALLAALLVVPASLAGQPVTLTLNPPPPDFETCKSVGGGVICAGSRPQVNDLSDTGIVCGSGADAFDIFDQGAFEQHATRYYDRSGNLTRRLIEDFYSFGQLSNPATGATVNYTQHNVQTDILAVAGDLGSSTLTITGENIFRAASGTGAPLFFATGRQVFNSDESELISSTPHNGFIAAFFQGDTTAFDQVCAALGAS
jgi:hypothetical protein